MKKILTFLLLFLSFFNIYTNYSLVYAENEWEQIELIEISIKNLKRNLRNIMRKYKIKEEKLNKIIDYLNELIDWIKKVKKSNLNSEDKEKVIKHLNKSLKNINNEIKETLKVWREKRFNETRTFQQPYNKLWRKFFNEVIIIINNINSTRLNKKILNLKESILKSNIEKLKEKAILLRDFENSNFYTEEEIKSNFKDLILDFKKAIIIVLENLKED